MTNEQLVLRIRSGEDVADNMAALYDQNRGMIAKLAIKCQSHAEFDDLMQEGYLGLCNAVDAWNPDEGVTFLHYAVFWIKQAMYRYIDNNGSSIRVPVYQCQRIRDYNKYKQQFLKELGREPEEWELCGLMGVSKHALDKIKSDQRYFNMDTLDRFVGEDEDTVLSELVADSEDKYESLLDEVQHEELAAVIWPMVDSLDGNIPPVLRMRYKEGKTLKETGETLGVTTEYVRTLQNKGLYKLRLPKYSNTLRAFWDGEVRSRGMRSTGVESFRRTWTSATERAAIELMGYD